MKRLYLILIFVYLVLMMLGAFTRVKAQGYEKIFTGINLFNNPTYGASFQVLQRVADGNYVVMGYGADSLLREGNYLIKFNPSGNALWSKFLPTTGIGHCFIEVNDGFLIGGYKGQQAILVKTDLHGNVLWAKSFSNATEINTLLPTANGFLMVGQKSPYSNTLIYLAEITANGDLTWSKIYNLDIIPKEIIKAPDGGYALICTAPSGRGHLVKLDDSGNVLWNKSYGYLNNFNLSRILITPDNNYLLAGSVLMKVDLQGNVIFVKSRGERIMDMAPTLDNNYITIVSAQYGNSDFQLTKMTEEGNLLWSARWPIENSFTAHFASAVLPTADGGFLAAAFYNNGSLAVDRGLLLIKTDANGNTGCNVVPVTVPQNEYKTSYCLINESGMAPLNLTSVATSVELDDSYVTNLSWVSHCCYLKPKISIPYVAFCQGDTFHLSGSGAPHLLWSTGDTTPSISTTDTLIYLTVSNTCSSATDSVILHPSFTPVLAYTLDKDSICPGDSVTVHISGYAPHYNFGVVNGNYSSFTRINDTLYIVRPITTTTYLATGTSEWYGPGCSSSIYITVYVTPNKPIITKHNDSLIASTAANYQWLFNGNLINGATSSIYVPAWEGGYSVTTVAANGCINTSDTVIHLIDYNTYSRPAWAKMISSPQVYSSSAADIQKTGEGGFVIAANTNNSTSGADITVVKTDANGNVEWTKTYGGALDDRVKAILVLSNGYLVIGRTRSFGNGNTDVYVLRLNHTGNLMWSKTYGNWNDEEGIAVIQTPDSKFVIAGNSMDPHQALSGHANNDIYLIRIDGNGNMLWTKSYHAGYNENVKSLVQSPDGGFAIGAIQERNISYIYVLKTDNNGNVQWNKLFKTPGQESAQLVSMQLTPDNKFFMSAFAYGYRTLLASLDESGNLLWSRMLDNDTYPHSMQLTNDGGAIISSSEWDVGSRLTKVNRFGKFEKGIEFNRDFGELQFMAAQAFTDNSFILAGTVNTHQWCCGPVNISLVKTDTDMFTNCSNEFYATSEPTNVTFYPCTTGVRIIGGQLTVPTILYPQTYQDTVFCRGSDTQARTAAVPSPFLFNIYPNPSTGKFTITSTTDNCCITIYNTMGEKVITRTIKQGTNHVDISEYSKGVYIFEMVANGNLEQKKIVLN